MLRPLAACDCHRVLAETPGLGLLCLSAPACGACRAMRRALEGLGAELPGVTLYEVDCGRDPGLTQEFDAFHLPALFLYRDGEFHAPLHCAPLPAAIAAAARAALARPAEEAP